MNWEAIAQASETLVIYMGVYNLANIVEKLLEAGRSPETPVGLIRWGTHPQQSELFGTLENIVAKIEAEEFSAPAIAVIGDVIHLRHQLLSACPPPLEASQLMVAAPDAEESTKFPIQPA